MLIDFKKIDKKKLMVLGAAIAAGIVAVVLTNAHINRTIEEGSSSKQVELLMEKVKALEQASKDVLQKQAAYASRVEQEFNNLAQRQALPAQEAQALQPRRQSLALKTPPGKRAITAKITTLSAVGGLLNPGDFVDVLVHLTLPVDPSVSAAEPSEKDSQKTTKTTVTLFQNIQILAIGANVDNPADFEGQQKTTTLDITFAVDPQQAELMTFADSHGSLQLVLRSPGEQTAYRLPSGTWETLRDYLATTQGVAIEPPIAIKKKIEVKKEPPLPEIRVYRAGASGANEAVAASGAGEEKK